MKAIKFSSTGGPEVLQYVDTNLPETLPGEVRIRHTAVGLNYIDTYHRKRAVSGSLAKRHRFGGSGCCGSCG